MPLEKNKATVRRFIEEWNKRNLAALDELMAADYFDPSLQVRGLEAYRMDRQFEKRKSFKFIEHSYT